MTSIDDLFKKPNVPGKRKLEAPSNPNEVYKSAKTSANGHAQRPVASLASVEDDDGEEPGPQLPPDGEEENFDPGDEDGRFFGSGLEQGTKEAMDFLDERDEKETYTEEKIDLQWLHKTTRNFEKRVLKNAELRGKHEGEPEKFMGSEADLDSDIKALSILSEHPELYPEFAALEGGAAKLVSLLSHENTDIAIDAIEIISELTDEDVQAEQSQWDALVDAMVEADLLNLITENLGRLDESNESDRSGVYHSLSIMENLASRQSLSDTIGLKTQLLPWLVKRIQVPETPFSQNKQYGAEVLSILLQTSPKTRKRFFDLNGTDVLLTILAAYRKKDPQKDSEEEEYVENLFDCLTCLLDETKGKSQFIEAEGVELCLIMLKEGKMSKSRALTALDHAVADAIVQESSKSEENKDSATGADVCEKLVEAEGLRRIFGLFMKKNDSATNEHLLGIFSALLKSLPGSSAARIRTLAKFVEKDYEKINKILQLRRDYAVKVKSADQQIAEAKAALNAEDRVAMEDEWFSQRLDAGLFSLQTIDLIIAWLVAEDDGAKRRMQALLADRDESLDDIKQTLAQQLEGIDDDVKNEHVLKDMLQTLMSFLT